jgi:hypothetical protein
MVFGGRRNKAASKATVLIAGACMAIIGGLLSVAVLISERVPDAPTWAIVVAPIITLGGLACGVYLIVAGMRMP